MSRVGKRLYLSRAFSYCFASGCLIAATALTYCFGLAWSRFTARVFGEISIVGNVLFIGGAWFILSLTFGGVWVWYIWVQDKRCEQRSKIIVGTTDVSEILEAAGIHTL